MFRQEGSGLGLLDWITQQPQTQNAAPMAIPQGGQNSVMQNPAIWDALSRMGGTMLQAGGQGQNFAQGLGAGMGSFQDAMANFKKMQQIEKQQQLENEIARAKLGLSQRQVAMQEREYSRAAQDMADERDRRKQMADLIRAGGDPKTIAANMAAIYPDKFGEVYLKTLSGEGGPKPQSDLGRLQADVAAGLVPQDVLQSKINEEITKGGGTSPELVSGMSLALDEAQKALDAMPEKAAGPLGWVGVKDPQMGPVMGRMADMFNTPEYETFKGAQDTLALQAKSLLKLPSSGFSDSDLKTLKQVVGGEYQSREGYQKALDRVRTMLNSEITKRGGQPTQRARAAGPLTTPSGVPYKVVDQ